MRCSLCDKPERETDVFRDDAEALDGILDSLRRDGDYMRRRAERQAEARQGWVEGLSFRPASIQQADRPPPSLGERVKESIDKVCRRQCILLARTPATALSCYDTMASTAHLAESQVACDASCDVAGEHRPCLRSSCRPKHSADAGAHC